MSGIKELVYDHSPIWFQNSLISAYGKHLARVRYNHIYNAELEELKHRDITDRDKLRDIQNRRFIEFLSYAIKFSPFYKSFYRDVDLSLIKTVDDITRLPILDKETLRRNVYQFYSTEKKPYDFSHTGGTTGKSLVVKMLDEDTQRRMAYLDWFKSLYGFTMGKDKHARFNGKNIIPAGQREKVFWRDNRSIHQRIYSSFFASAENLVYYVRNLNDYMPKELDGFCSTIYDIAKYMIDQDI